MRIYATTVHKTSMCMHAFAWLDSLHDCILAGVCNVCCYAVQAWQETEACGILS